MTHHSGPPERRLGSDEDDELLPCGRPLAEVWEIAEDPTRADAHGEGCPHCGRALDEWTRLESLVGGLRDETDTVASYDATPLTRRVMDVVRVELRPGRPLPLGDPAEDLWIMEAVAARTLRTAGETVAGVRAGSCRIVPRTPSTPGGSAGVDVRLDIVAPVDAALEHLAERVRERVLDVARGRLGMDVTAVDIRITDLTGPVADVEEGQNR
ncbi:Asp23/Gls24 family envelope stress response protein [Streptomyces sp. NPDC060011]|uniref:Asp23/Gls24 family envelope stress response protein n=1 Tax=Streptomyces sp. NPDC060011 TaxID=3347037 RepID=UPI00367CA4EC